MTSLRTSCCALFLSLTAAAEGMGTPIELAAGKTRELVMPGVSKAEVANAAVAAVDVKGPGSIRVRALNPGETTLTLYAGKEKQQFALTVTEPEKTAQLTLDVGEERTVLLPGVVRAAMLDPGVAEARVLGDNQVSVEGKAGGATQLQLWTADGKKRAYALNVNQGSEDPHALRVEVGAVTVLNLKGVSRIQVADAAVASARAMSPELVEIQGVSEGKTTVTVDAGGRRSSYVVVVKR